MKLTEPVKNGKTFRLMGLALVFLVTFRLSTCPRPPRMVRYFNYNIPQSEVLSHCQIALTSLGYDIASYEPTDNHLYTAMRKARSRLRKADYLVYIRVADRIEVYIYARTRGFKRASELGLFAGELTESDVNDNLSVSFQRAIFDPIAKEFEKHDFALWDEIEGNRTDDQEIRFLEERSRRVALKHRKKIEQKKREEARAELEEYETYKDEARTLAVDEAEHFVRFLTKNNLTNPDWSLIQMSKAISSHDEEIQSIVRNVMQDYSNYSGSGMATWVVAPSGRVADVDVSIETRTGLADDDLADRLSGEIQRWFFMSHVVGKTHIKMSRKIEFSGNYHNITFNFHRPEIVDVMDHYPPIVSETKKDTFFNPNYK